MLRCPMCAEELRIVTVETELQTIADAIDDGRTDEAYSRLCRLVDSRGDWQQVVVGLARPIE